MLGYVYEICAPTIPLSYTNVNKILKTNAIMNNVDQQEKH